MAKRKKAGAINYLQYKLFAIFLQTLIDCNSFAFKHSRINLLCFSTSQIEALLFIIFALIWSPIKNKKNKNKIVSPLTKNDRLQLILNPPN
jgi:hypothetical protein